MNFGEVGKLRFRCFAWHKISSIIPDFRGRRGGATHKNNLIIYDFQVGIGATHKNSSTLWILELWGVRFLVRLGSSVNLRKLWENSR